MANGAREFVQHKRRGIELRRGFCLALSVMEDDVGGIFIKPAVCLAADVWQGRLRLRRGRGRRVELV